MPQVRRVLREAKPDRGPNPFRLGLEIAHRFLEFAVIALIRFRDELLVDPRDLVLARTQRGGGDLRHDEFFEDLCESGFEPSTSGPEFIELPFT